MRTINYETFLIPNHYTVLNTFCDSRPKIKVGSINCMACPCFIKKDEKLKIVKCAYNSKPIFKSNEEAIKTAEIMFACTGFQPWTKEKIIKRLKEKGLIEETHSEPVRHDQEETEEDIIRTNLIPLVKQLLGKEYNTYMYNAYRWEKKFLGKSLTYKEWLKALLPKEVNNDNSNRE